MFERIQATVLQFSDPRKVTLLFSLLLCGLALAGCGDCPSGAGGGGCGGG